MRTTKIMLSGLLVTATLFGSVGAAGAATRSPIRPASNGSTVFAPSLGYTCTNGTCTCEGVADCDDMFGDLDCASDWIDETDVDNPFGECKGATRIRRTRVLAGFILSGDRSTTQATTLGR